MRAGRSGLLALALVALPLIGGGIAGCGSSASGPAAHTSDEQKAVDSVKNQTPEQQIAAAENSPMSRDQKDAVIKSIKAKNGGK